MSYFAGSEAAGLAGDYVGVESCIDLRNAEDFEAYERDCERSYERLRRRKEEEAEDGDRLRWREARGVQKERKEFPPPITYLTRTENQLSHMPLVMRRYHTADGRLVIREEKVRRHEYFRAHRADGRLTLQLVPLDDGVVEDCDGCFDCGGVDDVKRCDDSCTEVVRLGDVELKVEAEDVDEVKDEEDEEDVDDVIGEKRGAGDGGMKSGSVMVSSMSMSALYMSEGVNGGEFIGGGSSGSASASSSSLAAVGGGGGGGKKFCYGFNSLRSSSASSLFDLQVPAIRPVIS